MFTKFVSVKKKKKTFTNYNSIFNPLIVGKFILPCTIFKFPIHKSRTGIAFKFYLQFFELANKKFKFIIILSICTMSLIPFAFIQQSRSYTVKSFPNWFMPPTLLLLHNILYINNVFAVVTLQIASMLPPSNISSAITVANVLKMGLLNSFLIIQSFSALYMQHNYAIQVIERRHFKVCGVIFIPKNSVI